MFQCLTSSRKHNATLFILHLFTCDCSLQSIMKEQFELSKRANISLTESDRLTDFERFAYMSLIIEDAKRESEHYKKVGQKPIKKPT